MNKSSSPHATKYENLDATKRHRWGGILLFVCFMLTYIYVCDETAYYTKEFILRIRFNYWWGYDCGAIDQMFEGD